MRVLWLLARARARCQTFVRPFAPMATEQIADATFDVIRRFVYGHAARARAWRELGPDAPLRALGLIQRTDGTAPAPEHRQTFKVSRRVLALAYGDLELDPDLATIRTSWPRRRARSNAGARARSSRASARAVAHDGIVIAHGRIGSGRRSLLSAAAGLPDDRPGCARGRRHARRRPHSAARDRTRGAPARMRPRSLQPSMRSARSEPRRDRLDLVESRAAGPRPRHEHAPVARRWTRRAVQIELPRLDGAACARLLEARACRRRASPTRITWRRCIRCRPRSFTPQARPRMPRAAHFACSPQHIEARNPLGARRSARRPRDAGRGHADLGRPRPAGRSARALIVELLARDPRAPARLRDLGLRARSSVEGLGIAALFSGPPGTGKTMAAGLIARELGSSSIRSTSAKIVSKWIGETEKNLAALFDAAEAGHAILLFDEADALFGKRTDVKSSNDRHANQEVNFLLQRHRGYQGICILTTNHETAIDEAFQRRLAVHVRFPMPEVDERAHLWQSLIPSAAPTRRPTRLATLAERFVMSGWHIRNAVLRAAFLAADEDGAISAAQLAAAARLEYEAMGKIAAEVGCAAHFEPLRLSALVGGVAGRTLSIMQRGDVTQSGVCCRAGGPAFVGVAMVFVACGARNRRTSAWRFGLHESGRCSRSATSTASSPISVATANVPARWFQPTVRWSAAAARPERPSRATADRPSNCGTDGQVGSLDDHVRSRMCVGLAIAMLATFESIQRPWRRLALPRRIKPDVIHAPVDSRLDTELRASFEIPVTHSDRGQHRCSSRSRRAVNRSAVLDGHSFRDGRRLGLGRHTRSRLLRAGARSR